MTPNVFAQIADFTLIHQKTAVNAVSFLMKRCTFTKCLNQIQCLEVVKIKVRKNRDWFSIILFRKQIASKHAFFSTVTGADFNGLFDFTKWTGGHYPGADTITADVNAVDVFDTINPTFSVQMTKHQCWQILNGTDQF